MLLYVVTLLFINEVIFFDASICSCGLGGNI